MNAGSSLSAHLAFLEHDRLQISLRQRKFNSEDLWDRVIARLKVKFEDLYEKMERNVYIWYNTFTRDYLLNISVCAPYRELRVSRRLTKDQSVY